MLKAIFTGFVVKLITGVDDSLVHIPVIAHLTKTKKGKIAFALGILLAISFAIILGILFASILKNFKYYRYISGGLVIFLAFFVYFDFLGKLFYKKKQSLEKVVFSTRRFFKLVGAGFLIALITVIDDTLGYSAVFLNEFDVLIYVVIGIYVASFIQLFLIIYFSSKLQKIPYKKQISFVGLIILGILILFGVL